jgi:hypothetical protein
MFIRPGAVPGVTWIDETAAFAENTGADARAAVFAPIPDRTGVAGAVLAILGRAPAAQLALIIRKSLYDEVGGHANVPNPAAEMLRRLGRRRLVRLRTAIRSPDV